MQLIEDLSAKVQKLETNKDQDKAVSMDSKQIERMDTLERQVTQISAGSGQRKADGVPLHGFKMDVNDDLGSKTDVRMTGFYGTYITDGWELLSEYYHFNNRGITPGGSNKRSNAWFAQVGRNFDRWTPYARYEKTSLNESDPYFFNQTSGISYSRTALGLRYDLNATSALKAELNRTRMKGTNFNGLIDDRYSEARLQWAVWF